MKQEIILFDNIEFKVINDFPDYAVSKCGKILSLNYRREKRLNILKGRINNIGYKYVLLYSNKKIKQFKIHRLVAEHFISNPKNKKEVNHIDGNKLNNNVDNLEWNTSSENKQHAFKLGLRKPMMKGRFGKEHSKSKKVNQYDLKGNFIRTWDCISNAAKELGINNKNISACSLGKRKIAGNYIWKCVN